MASDGYIRLTYTAFLQLRFHAHMTWKDDELRTELVLEGFSVARAGYCEWTSQLTPAGATPALGLALVSLGWAWMESSGGGLMLVPHGIQSNLMLVLDNDREMGTHTTHQLLSHWLDTQPWQQSVAPSLASEEHDGPRITHPIFGHA